MSKARERRGFVRGGMAAGAAAALGDFGFLGRLPAVAADDARVGPSIVRLQPDVEPLVRLIEATPRERLLEKIAGQIHAGVGYRQLLASLLLAGVRNIHARPVGFEFHCVLVVHSAHQAALAASGADRWLPLFWALDNFKQSQAVKKSKGAWTMPVLDESKIPPAAQAPSRLCAALDAWDETATDAAVAGMARAGSAGELFELFARYGMRDFRHIGHKAIYVANAFRTLQTIGWRHAEPVLRSVAFAMLEYDGAHPAKADLEPDRPYRENLGRARAFRVGWQVGKSTPEAALDVLAVLRGGDPATASAKVLELVQRNVDPSSIWDGVFLATGELLMRSPGIVALHSVTTANALHYVYMASANDETRKLSLLQAAAFVALFAKAVQQRSRLKNDVRIDAFAKADWQPSGPKAVDEIFASGKDRKSAAAKALTFLDSAGAAGAEPLFTVARRLVASKGNDSHDYKFSSAVFEDYGHISAAWRSRYLASSFYWLRDSTDPDNALIQRARSALA